MMVDMLIRCGAKDKTDFVFYNTGLEYQATLSHLDELERKYNIIIKRMKAVKAIPTCIKEYGVPFWSKYVSEMLIEMRADGEITRDIFKAKKQEIEDRLLAIQNELNQLQPQEEAIDDATHDEKIKILKFYLEQSVNPDVLDNIPEDVIRAFIVKVVVFRGYLMIYLCNN